MFVVSGLEMVYWLHISCGHTEHLPPVSCWFYDHLLFYDNDIYLDIYNKRYTVLNVGPGWIYTHVGVLNQTSLCLSF